ncbi:hypothetical protein H8E50_06725 [bacterium]|nr:hypothetical protein [bacterium]
MKNNVRKYTFSSLTGMLVLLALGCLMPELTEAQVKYIHMERPRFGMNFKYDMDKDERTVRSFTSPSAGKHERSDFTETMRMATNGFIYHPALALYSLEFSPEWDQSRRKVNGAVTGTSQGFAANYAFNTTILQTKPYTFVLGAERIRSTGSSTQSLRNITVRDTYDTAVFLKYPILPTTLRYNHKITTSSGVFDSKRKSNDITLTMLHNKYLGTSNVVASYSDTKELAGPSGASGRSLQARFMNRYGFTEDVDLQSTWSFLDSSTTSNKSTVYNIKETVGWKINEKMSSVFDTVYRKSDTTNIQEDTYQARFDLDAKPNKDFSLFYSLSGDMTDAVGRDIQQYTTSLNMSYKKPISNGTLSLSSGHNYRMSFRDVTIENTLVENELIRFQRGVPALLINKHIDLSTLQVTYLANTDTTGNQEVLVEGVHYSVEKIGNFIRIRRLVGGDQTPGKAAPSVTIVDPDTTNIFVQYTYRGNPSHDFSVYSQSYSITLALWNVWDLSYNFNRSYERFIDGNVPDELQSTERHNIRSRFLWNNSTTVLDYEDIETTGVPEERVRLTETITFQFTPRSFLAVTGNFEKVRQKITGDRSDTHGASAMLQQLLSRRLFLSANASWRNTSGDNDVSTVKAASAALDWVFRIWSAKLDMTISEDDDELNGEKLNNFNLLFELSRELF